MKYPHAEDVERVVLASLLSGMPPVVAVGIEDLSVDDFYMPRHRTLFKIIAEEFRAGHVHDCITILTVLEQLKLLESLGGEETLMALQSSLFGSATLIEEYIYRLHEQTEARNKAEDAQRAAKGETPPARESRRTPREQGLSAQLQADASGERFSVPFPWPSLNATNALLPGSVSMLVGMPCAGKSFFVLQCLSHWMELGIKAAVIELEEDRTFYERRALAQRSHLSGLTEPTWVKEHVNEAARAYSEHAAWIKRYSKMLEFPNRKTSESVLDTVRRLAAVGSRVVVIDSLTARTATKTVYLDDGLFVEGLQSAIRGRDCSLFCLAHPNYPGAGKNATKSVYDQGGGTVFGKLASASLWLCPRKEETVVISRPMGTERLQISHRIQIRKARNGRGDGLEIGVFFDFETLLFAEQGLIVGE